VWFRSPLRSGMTSLDRRNIITAVEASLTKLGTDYIDLYQTHWPDHDLPYEETMEVLDELVRAGKVRVTGCSNETSWGLMKSIAASEKLGAVRYQTIQNNFSLNNRRFEDELAQVCRQEGVSLIPYSPIGGGVLSGKYQGGATPDGARFSRYLAMEGRQAAMGRRFVNDRSLASTERFMAIAAEAGMSPVTMAVAWSKQHDFVASTIVGVSKQDQVAEILAAADLVLSDETMKAIDKVSREIRYPMG
jgi:aryl-alcohol dehydrogenase-like predicted oxidoreductase